MRKSGAAIWRRLPAITPAKRMCAARSRLSLPRRNRSPKHRSRISIPCCARLSIVCRSRRRSLRLLLPPAPPAGSSISARWRCARRMTMADEPAGGGPLMRSPPERRQENRRIAFRTGISAESRAAAFLIAKGFRILARRWKSPVGEIDIVARRRSLLVFVEVKARHNLDDAAWSVTERQRGRIAAAAEAWLARYGDDRIRDIRFDAMLVAPGRIPRHIRSAFDASVPIPKFANPRGTL